VSELLQIPIRGSKFSYSVEISRRVARLETKWQQIEIVESEAFGKMLLLDGHIQLAELDEHAYHEALVHIPMTSIEDPIAALVIGGGDGGVIRELCRRDFQQIDMAEIDQGVIDLCQEHLPGLSNGAFDDPRVRVHVTDAFGFVKNADARYDLIVADSTDTYEGEDGNLSESLFTRGFYEDCRRLLRPGGIMVTQADNPVFCPYSTANTRAAFSQVFPQVGVYQAIVPSFGGFSGYCWGSVDNTLGRAWRDTAMRFRYLGLATYSMAFADLGFGFAR
jgi:spermidine synthase